LMLTYSHRLDTDSHRFLLCKYQAAAMLRFEPVQPQTKVAFLQSV
jgi:hypothetical protein